MSRVISGTLYVDSYVPTGNPGEYVFVDAIYENQSDPSGAGSLAITVGYIMFVPAVDINTQNPIPGTVLRYVITNIASADGLHLSAVMQYEDEGPENDRPQNGSFALISEPTENHSFGQPVSEIVYPNLQGGSYEGAIVNDIRHITDKLGLSGTSGFTGVGATGLQGATGWMGVTGPAGAPQGDTGNAGVTGFQGETGAVGLQGTTGLIGVTGIQGVGYTGLRGVTGLVGVTGSFGSVSCFDLSGIVAPSTTQKAYAIQGTYTGILGLSPTGIVGNGGTLEFGTSQYHTEWFFDNYVNNWVSSIPGNTIVILYSYTIGNINKNNVTRITASAWTRVLSFGAGSNNPVALFEIWNNGTNAWNIIGQGSVNPTVDEKLYNDFLEAYEDISDYIDAENRINVRIRFSDTFIPGIIYSLLTNYTVVCVDTRPVGFKGTTGPQGTTGLVNFIQTNEFPTGVSTPILEWNMIDDALYARMTGTPWVQISAGSLQGPTGAPGSGGGGPGFTGIPFGTQIPFGQPVGGFSTGIFAWDQNTIVTPAFDQINAFLYAIAPAPPGPLGGPLILTNTTEYNAILPTSLTAAWYQDGKTPGNIISSYIVDNTYNLSNSNPATTFKAGTTIGGDEGTVYHVEDGVDGSNRPMTSGVGITGNIQISSLATYNTIWRKANAQINYTQVSEGYKFHSMRYQSSAGNQVTSVSKFWYDNVNATPVVSVPTVVQNILISTRYLSGLRYYSIGDSFNISATIANIANKAIRPIDPISYNMPGINLTNESINGVSFAYTQTYSLTPTIIFSAVNAYSVNARLLVTGTKPNGLSANSTSASENRLVNTYPVNYSTNCNITMFDERYRYTLATDFSVIPGSFADPVGNWVSSALLTNGNGQLYNSTWYYPRTNYTVGYLPTQIANYSAFSGDQVIVWAANIGVAHSSMRIVFTGIVYTDISPVGTSNLNMEIRLPSVTGWLDCGREFGDGNGCRVGTSSGSTLNLTFGTNSSSYSNGVVFIRVTLRNSSAATASAMVITGT